MSDIIDFRGDYGFLSNFYERPIYFMGFEFKTGEHMFNSLKTDSLEEACHVMDAPTPGIAKQRGRKVTLRPFWDEVERYNAMRTVLGAKFLDDKEMMDALLSTGERRIIEGNTWHDNEWGNCTCGTRVFCVETQGNNNLGKLLMELRSDLRKWK
jgi:ribA/ribD-fused uncharacterized protein